MYVHIYTYIHIFINRVTRPEDISSDESEDDVEFEPIVVSRKSPEGRMMSKWLVCTYICLYYVFKILDHPICTNVYIYIYTYI
jgi:hypothetical protein